MYITSGQTMKLLELVEETFSSSHVVAGPSAIIKSFLLASMFSSKKGYFYFALL